MNSKKIIKTINSFGLKPASQRKIPLFTMSCVAQSYTKNLKREIGFGYKAMGVLGEKDLSIALYNEKNIAKETKKFIKKHPKEFTKIFKKAQYLFDNKCKKPISKVTKFIKTHPEKYLKALTIAYPYYTLSIGIYNCFWRYLGNKKSTKNLSPQVIEKISKERDNIAKWYPIIEKNIKLCTKELGKKTKSMAIY